MIPFGTLWGVSVLLLLSTTLLQAIWLFFRLSMIFLPTVFFFNLTCWPLSGKLFLNLLPKFSQVVTHRSHVYIRKPIRQQESLFYRLLLSFILSVLYTPVRWSSFETFLSKSKFFIDAINRHTITYATYNIQYILHT